MVEEVFTREGQLFELVVAGRVLRTTPEHPFFVEGQGWTPAGELQPGNLLSTATGDWLPVESITNTRQSLAVYNFRVSNYHTYFIAPRDAAFDVWVHNAYGTPSARGVHDAFVNKVRPGAKERIFATPWSSSKGFGTRKLDDFDDLTGTGFEGNTTPWGSITEKKLAHKLDQIAADYALLKTDPTVNKIVWFGTEELPMSGRGGQVREALQKAGIPY